jgi:hypothetical protein
MTDSPSDDARLNATEAQMRRALGLKDTSPVRSETAPQLASPGRSRPQRRQFVRDGEVLVSIIHSDQDDSAGANKLDAARQALQEQAAAREHVGRLLQEAQATIHDLQTKLAHERIARDEAVQRVDSEKQVVEQALRRMQEELAIERDLRLKAEQERDEAIAARQEAEERLRVALAVPVARTVSQASRPTLDPAGPEAKSCETMSPTTRKPRKTILATKNPAGGDKVKQARRRGRPATSDQSEAEIVEWWKPGWRDRFR